MEMGEFATWAVAWAEEHGGLWSVQENLVRLAEEVGEVARHVNAQGGRKALAPDAEPAAGEIGDALFVLTLLAHQLGTGLEDAAQAVRHKQEGRGRLRSQAPQGSSPGEGAPRQEGRRPAGMRVRGRRLWRRA